MTTYVVQGEPAAAPSVVKDEAEVPEAVAVQEAEDSEPEGSEVSYGSDEPHESYQSDADSDQGKIIPLDL